jgi:hypothetical protein
MTYQGATCSREQQVDGAGTRTSKPPRIFKGTRIGQIIALTSGGTASGCRRLIPLFAAICASVVLVDLGALPGLYHAGARSGRQTRFMSRGLIRVF